MKMMTPILIATVSLLGGCSILDSNETVVGSGPLVSSDISVSAFTRVASTGIADVNIVESSSQAVRFTAQAEILDVMTYKVTNGTLILSFEEDANIKTSKDITIDIQGPEIDHIDAEGTGDWSLSGSLKENFYIGLTGTGDVHAYNQEITNCDISSTGTGTIWIRVVDQLDIDLTGTGNVYYKGRPIINADITGTGNLISQN